MEQVNKLIICSQQLNPIEIKIDDYQIINTLTKYTGATYRFTPIGLLFPSSVTNDTNQIFVTCRELKKAKIALINGKILNILGVINLDKITNWKIIKGKSIWVNVDFQELKNEKSGHFSFSFKTTNLADLSSFSIYLIDCDNKKNRFCQRRKKISLLNFKIDIYQ